MLKIQENNYLPLLGGLRRSYGGIKSRKKLIKKSRKKSGKKSRKKSGKKLGKKSRKKSIKKLKKKSRKKPKHYHLILNKFKKLNDKIIEDCSKLDTHKNEIKIESGGTQGIIDEITIDNATYIRKAYKLLSEQNIYDFYSEVYALMDLQGIKYTPINFNKKIPQEEYEECLKLIGVDSKGEYNAVPTLYSHLHVIM